MGGLKPPQPLPLRGPCSDPTDCPWVSEDGRKRAFRIFSLLIVHHIPIIFLSLRFFFFWNNSCSLLRRREFPRYWRLAKKWKIGSCRRRRVCLSSLLPVHLSVGIWWGSLNVFVSNNSMHVYLVCKVIRNENLYQYYLSAFWEACSCNGWGKLKCCSK